MVKSDFESRLFQRLCSAFQPVGFSYFPEFGQFQRPLANGDFECISLDVTAVGKEYFIDVRFGVYKAMVETFMESFCQVMTNGQQHFTWRSDTGRFNGMKDFRFRVRDNLNFTAITQEIIDFFLTRGFSFMERNRSLVAIDALLNVPFGRKSRFISHPVHHYFKGLIIAKLIDSPHFHDLMDEYRNQVIKNGSSAEIDAYEKLISLLLYFNPN